MSLAAAIVVIFRREGAGGVLGRVEAETMKAERFARIMAVRRIVRSILGCRARGYELAAACTAEGGVQEDDCRVRRTV